MTEDSATLEKPADAGKGPAGTVALWLRALAMASKQEKDWRKTGGEVIQRYRQEGKDYETFRSSGGSKFNILWSNTEVQRPALYHSTPKPDVRRRFRDEDPQGKEAAQFLERGLAFSVDAPEYDFDQVMNLAVLDLLLPGRSVTRVRYTPTLTPTMPQPIGTDPETQAPIYAPEHLDEQGQPKPFDKITYQATYCEHVNWKSFRRGPGGTWDEVEWIAFQHKLTLEQITALCGDEVLAKKVSLEFDDEDGDEDKDQDEDAGQVFKRGEVWEIWDKKARKVLFIAPSLKERPLKEAGDELGLAGFFPIPRPMYALESSDSLVPVELFRLYKDQADELDRITARINKLVSACKVRGIYDATLTMVGELMTSSDNTLLPTKDAAIALMAQGGSFDKAIWLMPIDKIAVVLRELYLNRDQIKATIYEITGLSDIIRGESDPNETLGAQQIKAQSGSRRLRRMQKEVQRYARDLFRIMAEIMGEHFEPFMFQIMGGKAMSDGAMQVLRNDITRGYRIDIETDSTIAEDEQRDQDGVVKLLDGITRYVAAVGPVVQTGYMPAGAAVSLLKSMVRRFRLGREVEDALDDAQGKIEQSGGQMPPSPEQQAAQAQMQAQQQEMAMKQQAQQADLAAKAQAAELAQRAGEAEEQRKQQAFEREQQRLDQAAVQAAERANYELNAKIDMQRRQTDAAIEAAKAKAKAQPKGKAAA